MMDEVLHSHTHTHTHTHIHTQLTIILRAFKGAVCAF